MERTRWGIGLLLATGCSRGPLIAEPLGWLRHEYCTTTTEAALVAARSHYRAFTRHTLVNYGGSGLIRSDQPLFAHPYLDVLVPSWTDILFVYSDSPIWHDYIEQRLLPPILHRAIILNWSQRKRWKISLARAAFHHFGGYREFNPLAVVFRPLRRTRKFRFWQPFRDFKHGRPQALRKMEKDFFELIRVPYNETAT